MRYIKIETGKYTKYAFIISIGYKKISKSTLTAEKAESERADRKTVDRDNQVRKKKYAHSIFIGKAWSANRVQ